MIRLLTLAAALALAASPALAGPVTLKANPVDEDGRVTFGDIFEKGLTVKAGQTHVQKFMPELLAAIEEGKLHPNAIISHRLKLEQAAEGYKMFDKKEDDCRKVVLTP